MVLSQYFGHFELFPDPSEPVLNSIVFISASECCASPAGVKRCRLEGRS